MHLRLHLCSDKDNRQEPGARPSRIQRLRLAWSTAYTKETTDENAVTSRNHIWMLCSGAKRCCSCYQLFDRAFSELLDPWSRKGSGLQHSFVSALKRNMRWLPCRARDLNLCFRLPTHDTVQIYSSKTLRGSKLLPKHCKICSHLVSRHHGQKPEKLKEGEARRL